MNKSLLLSVFALTCFLLVGCGGGDKSPAYTNVSGTVKVNGQPLAKGKVTFSSDGRAPSVIDILDGNYAGQAMVGSNKITISALKKPANAKPLSPHAEAMIKGYQEAKKGEISPTAESTIGMEESIPAEWNTNSTQTRVVEAGGANKFDFEITSKK